MTTRPPTTISSEVQLRTIRRLRDERIGAEDQFRRELVRLMGDRGSLTVEMIAEAAGLTPARIYQIVKGTR